MIFCINQILLPALALGLTGAIAAVVLCIVARRFAVVEDERVSQVEALLPGANCGACGFLGCHDFAVQCVKLGGPKGISCPGAGAEGMAAIAALFGQEAGAVQSRVAVLMCAGTCNRRHSLSIYNGPQNCRMENGVTAGSLTCSYGCLQCGDCAKVCPFNAINMNPASRLPEIDEERCTGCGVCSETCPRHLLQLRPKGPKGRRVWVACSNHQRGGMARKSCDAACIGCGKCMRSCPFRAITLNDNLASIDPEKCRLCRKCVSECPTGAILTSNFPQPQIKAEA